MDAHLATQLRALACDSAQEMCGALVGTAAAIREVWPLVNRSDSAHDSFRISASDVLRAERAAQLRGLELIGFYHSHPRGAATPSPADLAEAVPGYVYAIIAQNGQLRCWRLRADRAGFDEVF